MEPQALRFLQGFLKGSLKGTPLNFALEDWGTDGLHTWRAGFGIHHGLGLRGLGFRGLGFRFRV